MAIQVSCVDVFQEEAIEFESFKKKVKQWIVARYEPAKTARIGVYHLKHLFEEDIGYVTHGALTVWLDEWGYRVHEFSANKNVEGTYNHCVYLKKKKLVK
jgi:hypothetical protein